MALPGHVPDIEDTRAVVHLTTIAAFGDALIGPRLRNGSGAARRRRGANVSSNGSATCWTCISMRRAREHSVSKCRVAFVRYMPILRP